MKKNPDGCSINNDYVAMVVRNFVCRKAVSRNIIKEGKRKEGKEKDCYLPNACCVLSRFTDM